MIKPDAVKKDLVGKILNHITDAGFNIKALKLTFLTKNDAEKFYAIHKKHLFFKNLVDFITSGPVVAVVLERENAVIDFRELIGRTNPNQAKEGSIRRLYAESVERNAIHGSDSDSSARFESAFFFSKREIF